MSAVDFSLHFFFLLTLTCDAAVVGRGVTEIILNKIPPPTAPFFEMDVVAPALVTEFAETPEGALFVEGLAFCP